MNFAKIIDQDLKIQQYISSSHFITTLADVSGLMNHLLNAWSFVNQFASRLPLLLLVLKITISVYSENVQYIL